MTKNELLSNYNTLQSYHQTTFENINQRIYQSQGLVNGRIININKNNLYFDVGLKTPIKVKKKEFLKTFFKIYKLLTKDKNPNIKNFFKNIKIGSNFKFIIYEFKDLKSPAYIDLKKTFEYIKFNKMFYELEYIRKNNKVIKGYIFNAVNGGFSVGIGGLVAFIPNNELIPNQFTSLQEFIKISKNFVNCFMNFRILGINFSRQNVILRRA